MVTHQALASIGLIIDILGAVWVVKSLLWISDDELALASDRVGVWGGANVPGAPQVFPRPALLAMFRSSRRDARIGATLLVVGFIGQLTAQWL